MKKIEAKKKLGRRPKFSEPRRPVTVTLPESTIRSLQIVDKDRARAIVKVTKAAVDIGANRKHVEVVEVSPGTGIILVGPSLCLQKISWLRLVEIAPTRFLLSIPSGTPADSLELALNDLLETLPASEVAERTIIKDLRSLIRGLRLERSMSKAEMFFVDTRAVSQNL